MASDGHRDYRPGLTKRDYFAAAALPALITAVADRHNSVVIRGEVSSDEEAIARQALCYADALIAASNTGGHHG
jgi:hypothetical protein